MVLISKIVDLQNFKERFGVRISLNRVANRVFKKSAQSTTNFD